MTRLDIYQAHALTIRVPILTTFVVHFEKLLGWRAQKGDHLGQVQFIIEMTVSYSTEETTAFE